MSDAVPPFPEIDVAVREEWRVTHEGNNYEDTFLTESEALAWAARWKAPVIDRRTIKVTTETSAWTRVTSPEERTD